MNRLLRKYLVKKIKVALKAESSMFVNDRYIGENTGKNWFPLTRILSNCNGSERFMKPVIVQTQPSVSSLQSIMKLH